MAKMCGYSFLNIDDDNNMVIDINGRQEVYKLLNVLEFSSARKRQSVILEDR